MFYSITLEQMFQRIKFVANNRIHNNSVFHENYINNFIGSVKWSNGTASMKSGIHDTWSKTTLAFRQKNHIIE